MFIRFLQHYMFSKSIRFCFLFLFTFFIPDSVHAQYTINGSATQDNCNCYTLTQAVNTQGGSLWNNNVINLQQSFDFNFQVFLGCADANGADGIAFVLQPNGTSVGTTGGGMGFQNVTPSVGVTLDTYQNSSPDNDPFYDHIAIQLNGIIDHAAATTLTPNTRISATNDNVEDCQNHQLRIVWNAATSNLAVFFDGQPRVNATYDFVNNVFGGNTLVYWGFTGATGGLSNLQQVCTVLSPSFHLLPTQNRCINEPITFYDSTVSFAQPVIRVWDFGDGTPTVNNVINPVHTYTAAGNYDVLLTVTGPDGCVDTFSQTINVGSKPIAGFTFSGNCVNNLVNFTDQSNAGLGTINSWYWDLDNNGLTATTQNTSSTYATPGVKTIKLVVKTTNGCVSDTLVRPVSILERPVVNFNFTDSVCLGTPTSFYDASTTTFGNVNYWQWTYSDSSFPATLQHPTHIFSTAGPNQVTLVSTTSGSATCPGTPITRTVFVTDKPVAAMKAVVPCERQSIQLQDSSYCNDGLSITNCWWDLGNGSFSNQCNPTVTYTTPGPKIIRHVVRNSRGCFSDTINITINVADKPIVRFGYTAPICNDSSMRFTDSSVVLAGAVNQWNWMYNNNTFSTQQNPIGYFPYGNVQVGLSVTSSFGCFSDTVYNSFRLIRNPVANMYFNDTCKYSPVRFTGNETGTNIGITTWQWNYGDGQLETGNPVNHTYTANGQYQVTLYATSVEGCKDTVVRPIQIYGTDAFAGNDTITAANQPVQLQASGGISYEWSPSIGLSATNVPNPIVTIDRNITYYLRAYTAAGCESYDTLNVIIYEGPEIYMPTAFTPNADGLNDVLTPFPVGLQRFDYFEVYNRYGQRIFRTTQQHKGWNGYYKGSLQPSGSYVWMVSGTDFTGKPMFRKGSVLLLR